MGLKVLAGVDDMFFASKIRETAKHLNVELRFARNPDALIEASRKETPDLIIVDLNSEKLDPIGLAKRLKDEGLSSTLMGFCSHVQTELIQQAEQAGYDRVLPRSAFTKQLPEILRGS
jgi:DNA-binding NarL/FixJ family response regulator